MRKSNYPALKREFLDRWSPRSFAKEPIFQETLDTLFEAARWAPSCYNDQPWTFLYANEENDLEVFRSLLVEKNQKWANNAPVLSFLIARKNFAFNDRPNNWAVFDCGAAWMSLALQANTMGLAA
ncbi:MAG: nitroreductase family protein, partial [Bacteriovoracia bacterium]